MSEAHHSEHKKVGVMNDSVPVRNLTLIIVVTVVLVAVASIALRKGFEQQVRDAIFTRQLSVPDSRLIEIQEQDAELLSGKAVGDLKPRMAVADAVKQVGQNENLLAPMRPASALGVDPAAGENAK